MVNVATAPIVEPNHLFEAIWDTSEKRSANYQQIDSGIKLFNSLNQGDRKVDKTALAMEVFARLASSAN